MDTKWASHLSKKPIEQEEFKNYIKASIPVLNRLREILTKDLEQSSREQKKVDHFDTPNWELRQVDCNATQRTLEKIINLLEI